jgi:hypothetical protein
LAFAVTHQYDFDHMRCAARAARVKVRATAGPLGSGSAN